MTALNIWHDGTSAFILNDTAMTDAAGRLIETTHKLVPVDLPTGRCVLAFTGIGFSAAVLRAWLASLPASHPADVVAGLSPMLRECEAAVRDAHGSIRWTAGVAAAVWCPDQRRPLLFAAGNDTEWLGDDWEPFATRQLGYWTTGAEPFGPFTFESPLANVTSFDPERDGLAMIEHQRRQPWPDGSYLIGGAAMLTRIGAAGVSTTKLREWPDVAGERIRPVSKLKGARGL